MCTFKYGTTDSHALESRVRLGKPTELYHTLKCAPALLLPDAGDLFRSHITILVLLQMLDFFAFLILLQQWSIIMVQLRSHTSCVIACYILFSILSTTTSFLG